LKARKAPAGVERVVDARGSADVPLVRMTEAL